MTGEAVGWRSVGKVVFERTECCLSKTKRLTDYGTDCVSDLEVRHSWNILQWIWKQTEAVYGAQLRYWRKCHDFGGGNTGFADTVRYTKWQDDSTEKWK